MAKIKIKTIKSIQLSDCEIAELVHVLSSYKGKSDHAGIETIRRNLHTSLMLLLDDPHPSSIAA